MAATALISISASGCTKPLTATSVLVGYGSEKCRRRTSWIACRWLMSLTKTVTCTTSCIEPPTWARCRSMLVRHCSVWARMSPGPTSWLCSFTAVCPETQTSRCTSPTSRLIALQNATGIPIAFCPGPEPYGTLCIPASAYPHPASLCHLPAACPPLSERRGRCGVKPPPPLIKPLPRSSGEGERDHPPFSYQEKGGGGDEVGARAAWSGLGAGEGPAGLGGDAEGGLGPGHGDRVPGEA